MKKLIDAMKRVTPKSLLGAAACLLTRPHSSYSQFGEDLHLLRLLDQPEGFYVDIGAFHPKHGSNTYRLWRRGWTGINIDVDEYKISLFRRFRKKDINLVTGVSNQEGTLDFYSHAGESYGSMSSFESEFTADRAGALGRSVEKRPAPVTRLDTLLERHLPRSSDGSLQTVDLMTIDVEGHELAVLEAADFTVHRPRCLCVEIHGATLAEVASSPVFGRIEESGYELVAWPSPSCIFLAKEEIARRREQVGQPVGALPANAA